VGALLAGNNFKPEVTYLVEDACFTFGRKDWSGVWRTAAEVHAMSLSNLDAECCAVVRTEEVLDVVNG
jgi:isochorismate hydrolase